MEGYSFSPKIHEYILKLREFMTECSRVLKVTKKPDAMEFKTIVKVSAMGMGLIGLIGFLIFFLKEILL